jgi:hypothetical protein
MAIEHRGRNQRESMTRSCLQFIGAVVFREDFLRDIQAKGDIALEPSRKMASALSSVVVK